MIECGKKIYLSDPGGNKLAVLNGVVTDSVQLSKRSKDYTTLSFDVDQYIIIEDEQIQSNRYDDLKVGMYLCLEDIGLFIMEQPEVNNDGIKEVKSITAYSCEKEFQNKDLLQFKVNTGEDGSLERLNPDNIDDLGIAKDYVTFYRGNDSGETDYSLIHYFLEQMPGWAVRDEDIDKSLWYKKATFDEENTNLYALLTSVVAPKFECIITFDILNKRIGAISKDHLETKTVEITKPDGSTETVIYNNDFDSSIFIGFRNLANSVQITTDEDSVFTQFTCSGDEDLTFEDVNYGQSTIIDLSYFMCEPYMRQATIDKLKKWEQWCSDNRNAYIDTTKQWAKLNDQMTELTDRVPSDMDYWKQWSEMDSDLLDQNLKYYQTLLESLQVSVDDRPDSEKYTGTGDDKKYNPIKKSDGTVDHEWYMERLKQGVADYGGYYTYFEIITYVLPNIQIAIENKGKVESKQSDYVKTYETDWSLYGVTELQNKKKVYEGIIDTLGEYSLPFESTEKPDGTKDVNEPDYTKKYSEYWNAKNNLATLEPVLTKLLEEQKALQNQIDAVIKKRGEYERQYLFYYKDSSGNDVYNWDLTKKEYILISTLIRNTDYTNSNIFKTSMDTAETKIDREKELFDDSVSKLSEVSQPQYKFTVDLDNMMRIPEFSHWVGDLQLYKFIRLGIRDDYSVKLRIVGMTYNPCEITPDITLEFSNMITSSSGCSDLTDILDSENNRGSKNSISLGASTNYDIEFATTLLQTMMNTGLFRNSVSNVVGDLNITGTAVIDRAKIKQLFAEYVEAGEIKVGYISGSKAEFEEFYSKYGAFNELVSNIISSSTIYTDKIMGKDGENFIDFINGSLNMDNIVTNIITGKDGDKKYYINMLTGELNMDTIISNMAKLNEAEIGKLFVDTAFANHITSISSSTAKSVIDYAYIHDAIVGKMTAGELLTGDIVVSDKMRILSNKDAKAGMVVNGSVMQFIGSDGQVGIQIGFGANEKPSLIIRDDNGATILTSQGITKDAIADGLIVNNMIKDGTVSESKLGFQVIKPNAQGGLDITQIYDGKGNKWGVENTQFAKDIIKFKGDSEKYQQDTDNSINGINSNIESLQQKDTAIDGQIDAIQNSITGIESVVDKENKTIKDAVWENVYLYKPKLDANGKLQYDSDGHIITEKDAYNIIERNNETIRTLTELTTTIYEGDMDGKTSRITTAMQTAEKFNWLVKNGSTQSSLILTDSMLEAITGQFKVTGVDGTSTIIEGGKLATDAIKSVNYVAGSYIDGAGYSSAGTFLDLSNGMIHMPGLYTDKNGSLNLKGTITSSNGTIGGWTLSEDSIYRTSNEFKNATGMYFGLQGLSVKDKFSVTSDGILSAVDGIFSGTINSINGEIGGWEITADAIYKNSSDFQNRSGMYFGSKGLSIKDKFSVSSTGVLEAVNGKFSGTINADFGTIADFNIFRRLGFFPVDENSEIRFNNKGYPSYMNGTVKTYPIPNKITNFIGGIFGFDINYELAPHTTQQKVLCKYNVIYHYSDGKIITSDTVTVLSETNDSEDTLYYVQPFQVDGLDSSTGVSYIEVVMEANNLDVTNFYSSSEEDSPSFIGYKAVELGKSDNGVYIGTDGISLGKSCILHSSGKAELKDIKADGGSIGGWTIGNNSLYNGTNSLDSTTAGLYLGIDGIRSYFSNGNKAINIHDGTIESTTAGYALYLGYSNDIALYGWDLNPNSYKHFSIYYDGRATFASSTINGSLTIKNPVGSGIVDINSGTVNINNAASIGSNGDISCNSLSSSGSVSCAWISTTGSITGGRIQAGGWGDNSVERQVHAISGAGDIYLYSQAASGGNMGLYAAGRCSILALDSRNWVIFDQPVQLKGGARICGNKGHDSQVTMSSGGNWVCLNRAGNDGTFHGNLGSSTNYWNGVYYKSLNKVSDKRKKRDLGNLGLEETLMILNQTRTVKYSMLDDSEDVVQYGVFAQDVRDMLRDNGIGYRSVLNIGLTDGSEQTTTNLYESEDKVSYSIDYTQFVAPLIKGWQYHDQLISDLQQEIKELHQRIDILEGKKGL